MNKKKYSKPSIKVKKLQTYFFACLRNTASGCNKYFANKTVGAGCPS